VLRRVLFQLHLWCGVALGLFLVVQAITGVAVAFRHAGNRWVHHDEMIIAPDERPQIPMSAVLDSFDYVERYSGRVLAVLCGDDVEGVPLVERRPYPCTSVKSPVAPAVCG
jgi:uncharacterized iron-regulated membrane protein